MHKILVLALLGFAFASEISVDEKTANFVDSQGRQRFFHGANVVFKGSPWIPVTDKFHPQLSLSREDVDFMKEWGFNSVRLGVMWPGVEPVRGQYNETYLEALKNITLMLWENEIYTILDFHQDCLAASFCGEGIPEWAVVVKDNALAFPEPFGRPFSHEKRPPIPSDADCAKHNWASYQATGAASSAYQNLYDAGPVRDAFVEFWQRVSRDYIGAPQILAVELINEPWAGDVFRNPALIIPGVADKVNLAPFYEAVAAGIREVDSSHIIMFESVTWDDIRIGFSSVPGGDKYLSKSSLSYHFYIPPNLQIHQAFSERAREIKRLKTAGFLTEFAMCDPPEKVNAMFEESDKHLVSWSGWEYKPFVPITGVCEPFFGNGSLDVARARLFARTYAYAVAGQVQHMRFNDTLSLLDLSYTINSAATLPTEIYYPAKLRYASGAVVKISPESAANYTISAQNTITIQHAPQTDGVTLNIQIYPVQ